MTVRSVKGMVTMAIPLRCGFSFGQRQNSGGVPVVPRRLTSQSLAINMRGDLMLEIPEIDLAWETVNALGASSARNKALQVIEQAGGKDPRPRRILDAAEHSLGEFKQAAENQGLAEVAAVLARAIANIKG